jgi:hypothetical protein
LEASAPSREYVWLWDVEHGRSVAEVSRREGVSTRRIRQGIAFARGSIPDTGDTAAKEPLRPPRLEPLFPVLAYTPFSACPHYGRMRDGTRMCCMICHLTGVEAHPALQRDRGSEPKPEKKPPVVVVKPAKVETRRERRARQFAAQPARSSP